jgi:hypothetical protein
LSNLLLSGTQADSLPEVTIHSRAARRAASPSIDLDKSLKPAAAPSTRDPASPSRPSKSKAHALGTQNAGIQKKQKKGNMTRAQRLRHEKGLERAAAVIDKQHVKIVKSLDKEKIVKERSKGWEDVNGDGKKKKKTTNPSEELGEDEQAKRDEREWVNDEEMDDTEAGVQTVQDTSAAEVKGDGKPLEAVVPESVALPVQDDELL